MIHDQCNMKNVLISLLFLMFIFMCLVSCSNDTTGPNNLPVKIQGKVTDAQGAPLPDVSIHLVYGNWNNYYPVISSGDLKKGIKQIPEITNPVVIPGEFRILQNHPNPFNPQTHIGFTLPQYKYITLDVFDWPERNLVRTLWQDSLNAGNYTMAWDGHNDSDELLSNGLYTCVLKADTLIDSMIMCIQMVDWESLEYAKSVFKTDSNGEFEIDYSSIPIGEAIPVTSEVGPDTLNFYTVTNTIYMVLTKSGYLGLENKVELDTTKSLELNFTLMKP